MKGRDPISWTRQGHDVPTHSVRGLWVHQLIVWVSWLCESARVKYSATSRDITITQWRVLIWLGIFSSSLSPWWSSSPTTEQVVGAVFRYPALFQPPPAVRKRVVTPRTAPVCSTSFYSASPVISIGSARPATSRMALAQPQYWTLKFSAWTKLSRFVIDFYRRL